MTDETKKLFDAPWQVWGGGCQVCDIRGIARAYCEDIKDSARITSLPELYDALLHCICSSCNVCIYDHCDSPVDCEQLLSQECTYEDSKLCFEHEARELLKKVRDGE